MSELNVHARTCEIERMVQNIEMIRSGFAARLKEAAADAGLKEWGLGKRLADAGKVTPKAASKWLNLESMPDRLTMLRLADFLKVRAEWLEHGVEPKHSKFMTPEMTREAIRLAALSLENAGNVEGGPLAVKDGLVPVVGMAQLGTDGYFEAMDYPVGHGDGYIRISSDDPNAYALKVVGNSMEPRIRSGEFVIIEPNKPYVAGDEVLVRTIQGQSMIKVFMYARDGMVRLLSVNDAHPPLTIAEVDIEKIHFMGAISKSTRYVEL